MKTAESGLHGRHPWTTTAKDCQVERKSNKIQSGSGVMPPKKVEEKRKRVRAGMGMRCWG